MENRVEIIPGIYIGKRNAIDNPNLNNIQGIKKIIDTQSDLSFIGKSNEYNHKGIKEQLQKYEVQKTLEYFRDCSNTIMNHYLLGTPLMIICDECDQLSPSVVLYFLVHYAKINIDLAIKLMRSKKVNIFDEGVRLYSLIKNSN
jgi:type IV secretory pathway VirB4 component